MRWGISFSMHDYLTNYCAYARTNDVLARIRMNVAIGYLREDWGW